MKSRFELIETVKGHWYYLENKDFPNGANLPSVTNILEAYPNPGLDYWRENTSPEEIKQRQDDGKMQGSKVHDCIYLISQGEEIMTSEGITDGQLQILPTGGGEKTLREYLQQPLTKREIACLEGYENFWEEMKPVTVAKELQVYSKKHMVAGTLDWIGYLWDKKEKKYKLWMIDYKISKTHTRSYDLQIATYHNMLCEMTKKRPRINLGILYVGKPTKKKFQLKEVEDRKKAFQAFLNVKKVWHDANPKAEPKQEILRERFKLDTSHTMKGRRIRLNI